MKQAITLDQLKELSEKGLASYKNYLKGKYADALDYILTKEFKPAPVEQYEIEQLPLLSLGQLLELLDERVTLRNISRTKDGYSKKANGWYVNGMFFEDWELCDILWQRAKTIFEA